MKTNLSSISKLSMMFFMALITAMLSGCNSEVTNGNDGNDDTNPVVVRDGTVFSDGMDATRTSIGTTGLFYWETGDHIWVDENKDGTFLLKSSDSELAPDKRTANFYFRGKSLQDGPYDLTYTGNGSSSGTSVTIKADQSQLVVNDSTHIGTSGDCATATATQQPSGNYTFKLRHKAHYLIFQPYKPDTITNDWKLMSIEIIDADDKTICGTYPFGMGGLDQTRATGTQSQVTLTLGGTGGYLLPNKTAWNSSKGSWYAVIAPDTENRRLRIRYNIKPTRSGNEGVGKTFTIMKELYRTFAPNGVTRVRHELGATSYSTNLYYTWDAEVGEYYWKGVSNPPNCDGQSNNSYPKSSTDSRWYNTVVSRVATPQQASRSCKDLPNVNAMTWYAMKGDPRWEDGIAWCLDGNYADVYSYGIWFLTWDNIPGKPDGSTITDCELSAPDINGIQRNGITEVLNDNNKDYRHIAPANYAKGRPNSANGELDKYFYLPALGHYTNGAMQVPHGCYWSSSVPPGASRAEFGYYMVFQPTHVGISPTMRRYGGRTVTPGWFK